MDSKPNALAIAQFLQRDRKVVDEMAWVSDGQFERKSTENLAILVRYGGETMPPEDAALLGKILSAISKDIDKLDLIDIDSTVSIRLTQLKKAGITQAVCFGIHPRQLSLNVMPKAYTTFSWLGVQLLFADSLEKLATSNDHKKALWGALKKSYL